MAPAERSTADVVLGVRDVSKRFVRIQALDRVTMSVHRDESVALIGANGAGKSTLVKILTGALAPDSGDVVVDGRVQPLRTVRDARHHGIGFVPQELTVAPDLTVAENVLAGGWKGRGGLVRTGPSVQLVEQVCERVGLHGRPRTPVGRLSPGERRLVMVARALVMGPTTLILDEPTAALAEREAERIVSVLCQLRGDGMSVVYISHRMGEITQLCDTLVVLRDGAVVMSAPATPATVDEAIAVGMSGTVGKGTAVGTAAAGAAASGDERRQAGTAGPSPAAPSVVGAGPAATGPALACRDLRNRTLRGVSLEVRYGEIVGLAGLLGSGRTEILRALAGADALGSGTIEVSGRPVVFRSPADAIGEGVALVPEERRTQGGVLELSVRENLVLPMIPARRGGWLRRGAERKVAAEAVERFGIRCPSPDAPLKTLSGGNQQKVILARWLLTGCRVLLLDEPTAGIDVVAKRELMGLVRDVVRDGHAAIVASSELSELVEVCDRIYVISGGTVASMVDRGVTAEELARRCGERRGAVTPAPPTSRGAVTPAPPRSKEDR
ncbi:MAG TPA: sugar ABC transporter ATP-binding protein [Acidimicrobiales bacterium]|nr:sugar ABC transporter ATP-binding protein [Acidimicrobiales bacterium]